MCWCVLRVCVCCVCVFMEDASEANAKDVSCAAAKATCLPTRPGCCLSAGCSCCLLLLLLLLPVCWLRWGRIVVVVDSFVLMQRATATWITEHASCVFCWPLPEIVCSPSTATRSWLPSSTFPLPLPLSYSCSFALLFLLRFLFVLCAILLLLLLFFAVSIFMCFGIAAANNNKKNTTKNCALVDSARLKDILDTALSCQQLFCFFLMLHIIQILFLKNFSNWIFDYSRFWHLRLWY